MPTPISVLGALVAKFDSLLFTPKPDTIYVDRFPVKDDGGTAVGFPRVLMTDRGSAPQIIQEGVPFEQTNVTLSIYATTLAAADAIAWGVKYDGGTPQQFLGFDGAENSGIAFPIDKQKLLSIVRTREQRFQETIRGPAGELIFRVELDYTVETHVTGV